MCFYSHVIFRWITIFWVTVLYHYSNLDGEAEEEKEEKHGQKIS